jgi:hypothetical protein
MNDVVRLLRSYEFETFSTRNDSLGRRQNTLTSALSISSSHSFKISLTIFATGTHDRVGCPYQDDAQPRLDGSKS